MNRISELDLKFLEDLANEIKTQNNRATATPYYYVIKKQKRISGMDPKYADKTIWVNVDGNDHVEFKTEEEAIKHIMESHDLSIEEAQEYCNDYYEEAGYFDTHEKHNMFLTYKGLLEHMKLNGHNYSHRHDSDKPFEESEELHSYIEHAFRNPELEKLLKIISKFATK